MNAQLRTLIRTQRDQHTRQRLNALDHEEPRETCTGCGGELDTQTIGCTPCSNRRTLRQRRQNPQQLARMRQQWRESNQRQRAKKAIP